MTSTPLPLTRAKRLLDAAAVLLQQRLQEQGVAGFGFESAPFPAWVKDVDGRMGWLNREYEAAFEKTLSEYRGLNDIDVWGPIIGEQFMAHDKEVMHRRRSWLGEEELPNGMTIRVLKWPVFDEAGDVVGVCGAVLP